MRKTLPNNWCMIAEHVEHAHFFAEHAKLHCMISCRTMHGEKNMKKDKPKRWRKLDGEGGGGNLVSPLTNFIGKTLSLVLSEVGSCQPHQRAKLLND